MLSLGLLIILLETHGLLSSNELAKPCLVLIQPRLLVINSHVRDVIYNLITLGSLGGREGLHLLDRLRGRLEFGARSDQTRNQTTLDVGPRRVVLQGLQLLDFVGSCSFSVGLRDGTSLHEISNGGLGELFHRSNSLLDFPHRIFRSLSRQHLLHLQEKALSLLLRIFQQPSRLLKLLSANFVPVLTDLDIVVLLLPPVVPLIFRSGHQHLIRPPAELAAVLVGGTKLLLAIQPMLVVVGSGSGNVVLLKPGHDSRLIMESNMMGLMGCGTKLIRPFLEVCNILNS
mmetsp:Transcript_19239/g.34040  ORF Transcript_19239/g.34040 Transcript_19239/m.34040 type:complete len:286 (-) Transcript_19239:133-990(-)